MTSSTTTRRKSSESWKTACDNPVIDWGRSWTDKEYAKEHEDQCSFRSCCSCRAVIVVKGSTSPRVNCRKCAEKRDTGNLPSVSFDPNRGLAVPFDFPAPDGSNK